jgi:hypothetical protein
MREIPALRERDSGFPTTNVTNEIVRAVQAMAPIIQTGQAGEPLANRSRYFEVRITSDATGGEIYKGKSLLPPTVAFDPAEDASLEMIGVENAEEDWYLINIQQEGKTTHSLTAGTPVNKTATVYFLGVHTDGLKYGFIKAIDLEPCEEEGALMAEGSTFGGESTGFGWE